MSSSNVKTSEPRPGPPLWRRVLKWLGLLLLLILVGFLIFAAWVWSNRYQLAENAVIDELAKRGLTAELSIHDMTRTAADVRAIRLSDETGQVLSVGRLEARYEWRDALEGRFIWLKVTEPDIRLTLDENVRPVASWMPAPSPAEARRPLMDIPPEGLIVEGGRFDLTSPYGHLVGQVDGEIQELDQFKVDIKLGDSEVLYGGFNTQLSGPLSLQRKGEADLFNAKLNLNFWSYKDFSGENTDLEAKGEARISSEQVEVDGTARARFDRADVRLVTTRLGAFDWNGHLSLPRDREKTVELNGNWGADIQDVVMSDPDRRLRLAEALTLRNALSQTPVAEHFSGEITRGVDNILSRGNLNAKGRIAKTQTQTDIFFDEDMNWVADKGSVVLMAVPDAPSYAFNRDEKRLILNFDAVFDYPRQVKMENIILEMTSETGRDLESVTGFSSRVKSIRHWRTVNQDGLAVRLAPFVVDVDYVNQDRRHLKMRGAVDYDGDIPGGYATGLRARGDLHVNFDRDLKVRFASFQDQPVLIERFDTVTDWYAENVSFRVPGARPFFTRSPNRTGYLKTELTEIITDLSRTDGSQSMHLNIKSGTVDAKIVRDRQDWTFTGGPTRMTSENMPSPGTEMTTEQFDLDAVLIPGAPVEFTLTTPKADVKTQLVTARGLAVQAGGTPDRIQVDYQNGWVKFLAAELPELPMTGDVIYQGNRWAGQAVTFLAGAKNTPIQVDYQFENGQGTAQVDIVDLPFRPRGLQPQSLISALKGKIADVDGLVSAQIDLSFGTDQPLQSSGRAQLKNMSLGTLPGPMIGVNADLGFSSFFPLESEGLQSLTMESFDPGFPLRQGQVDFQLIPDGVDIASARWPLGDGYIALEPTQWRYLAAENRMTLKVEDVSLGEFFNQFGNDSLKATGQVNGVLPVTISGVNVEVTGGYLEVANGGVIQYISPQTDAAAAQSQHAEMAFEALKDFRYERLELLMDGPLDGEIVLKAEFLGSNPEVLYGSKFKFNVTMTGELLNIVRSFRIGPEILGKLKDDLARERAVIGP